MTVGRTLRMLRERREVSLHWVAKTCKLSSSVVHGAEGGKAISYLTLQRIVVVGLEMRMSEFWAEQEASERKTRRAAA